MKTRVNAQFDDDPEGYLKLRAGRQFGRRLARTLDFLTDARPDDLVVEIGAGTGGLLEGLADARPDLRFLGVEPLPNYVAFARSRWEGRDGDRLRIVEGTAEDLDRVVDSPARWIFSHDVLHHVDDIPRVAQLAAKATTDDARWLVIEPNRSNPWMFLYSVLTPGERLFHMPPFLDVARAAGWEVRDRFRFLLIPHALGSPPQALVTFEERYEHLPVISGAVGAVLERQV